MATIDGTAGDDSLAGTDDFDTFNLEDGGSDTISGGLGNDAVFLGATLDRSDRLDGGEGSDLLVLDGDYSAGFVFGAHTAVGFGGMWLISGHAYDLTFHDNLVAARTNFDIDAQDDVSLDASGETDGTIHVQLSGGSSARISLGAQNDSITLFRALSPDDVFQGGAGSDYIEFFPAVVARFTGETLSGFETLRMFAGGSRLVLEDSVVAAGERMTITDYSGGGLFASGGRERDGVLALYGGAGNDSFIGGSGDDTLAGRGGDDVLKGGLGGDQIDPGTGADMIVYQSQKDSKAGALDTILTLDSGDQIDLSRIDADKGAAGDQAFQLVEAPTGAAGEAWLVYDGVDTLLMLEINGKGHPDMAVILANGDHTDFTNFVL